MGARDLPGRADIEFQNYGLAHLGISRRVDKRANLCPTFVLLVFDGRVREQVMKAIR